MTIGPSTWPFNNAYRLTQGFFRFFLLFFTFFKKNVIRPWEHVESVV